MAEGAYSVESRTTNDVNQELFRAGRRDQSGGAVRAAAPMASWPFASARPVRQLARGLSAPLWRPSHLRGLCTPAAGSDSWSTWAQKRKDKIIPTLLTGCMMLISIQNVNLRNKADDMEAEMLDRLRTATVARRGVLLRAPELACEMGLPKNAEGKFRAALQKLDEQYMLDPKAAAPPPKAPSVSSGAATPATTAPAAGGAKAQAVW